MSDLIPIQDDNQQEAASDPSPIRQTQELIFRRALEDGPHTIPQQLRYLMAFCHLNTPVSSDLDEKTPPIPLKVARLQLLSNVTDIMSQEQLQDYMKSVNEVEDPATRLPLLLKLALKLKGNAYRLLLHQIWSDTQTLTNPIVKAQVLLELTPLLSLLGDEPETASPLLTILGLAQSIQDTEARLRSLIALAPLLPYTISIRLFRRVLDEIDESPNDALSRKMLTAIVETLPDELGLRALTIAEGIENPSERAQALTVLARRMLPELQPRLRQEALDAIRTIENEDERTDSLINFAPHLDYASENKAFPAILAKALSITIDISRRHLRARVLVALAPHLTIDLQGEALAAVHSLSSEHERAALLSTLAPTLPPNMLVASLAVAHTMQEPNARVHALTVLARYVPEYARNQTMLDALSTASNLPHPYERVSALVALLDILPDQLREKTLDEALEAVQQLENENARTRTLLLLGNHLPSSFHDRVLEISRQIENPELRLSALTGLITQLDDKTREAVMKDMMACTQQILMEYKQARAFINIAQYMSADTLAKILAMANEFEDAVDRANVYVAIAHNTPPDQRATIIGKIWMQLVQIEDGYDRANLIAAIAPNLPDKADEDLSKEIISAIEMIGDAYDQASAISLLTPLLVEDEDHNLSRLPDSYTTLQKGIETAIRIPVQENRSQSLAQGAILWSQLEDVDRSYILWKQAIWQLRALPLPDVLVCLGALTPVIRRLAGEDGLQKIAHILGIR